MNFRSYICSSGVIWVIQCWMQYLESDQLSFSACSKLYITFSLLNCALRLSSVCFKISLFMCSLYTLWMLLCLLCSFSGCLVWFKMLFCLSAFWDVLAGVSFFFWWSKIYAEVWCVQSAKYDVKCCIMIVTGWYLNMSSYAFQ